MTNKMREEFEEWAISELLNEGYCREAAMEYLSIGLSGDYSSIRFSGAWIGWQASRAALCVELPKAWRSVGSTHELIHKQQTIESIHAAGVKTK